MLSTIETTRYLTVPEAARRLGKSVMTIRRWIWNWRNAEQTIWQLRAVRTGERSWGIAVEDIDDLLRRANPELAQEIAQEQSADTKAAKAARKKLRERLG